LAEYRIGADIWSILVIIVSADKTQRNIGIKNVFTIRSTTIDSGELVTCLSACGHPAPPDVWVCFNDTVTTLGN